MVNRVVTFPDNSHTCGMTNPMPLLVFTDLDGTLLSHADYGWDAALPALHRLADIGAGVVMASSKTAAEITVLRQQMGLGHWPAIVENGAGRLEPAGTPTNAGSHYAQLRDKLNEIPSTLRCQFNGFGDIAADEVADITGLPRPDAVLAKQRAFSEPGLWSGTEQEKADFLSALAAQGIAAREGGRFLTLSFGGTKADQMAKITAELAPASTMALGDAPNDVEMLATADFGVIVANPHRAALPSLTGENTGRITRTTLAGPEGWNTAVLAHLDRLKL